MTHEVERVEIVPVPVPVRPLDDGWDLFAEVTDIASATEVAGYGLPEVAFDAAEVLPDWLDPEQLGHLFAAVDGGRVVGRLAAWAPAEAPAEAIAFVQVLPDEQGHGVGSRLHDRLLALAADQRYRKVISWVVSPDAPGERLEPPTGSGSVPAANREVRFLLDRGWRLEQVERASRLALPVDPAHLAALRADAERHADGYALHTWEGVTPTGLRDGMAELFERMTTDAPSAGLEEPAERWDAARVVENDERRASAPQTMLATAVEHRTSGRLAGMTRLAVPDDPDRAVRQWDTIVREEDRGHRLGMLLKVANLAALEERRPGHPSVLTWNAEENRHMLVVNEAIGFAPIGYEGAWRLDLD